jgi:hypothetical protein
VKPMLNERTLLVFKDGCLPTSAELDELIRVYRLALSVVRRRRKADSLEAFIKRVQKP